MIECLYPPFKNWADGGSVWIISDLHFEDIDCKHMDPNWISPQEQVDLINKYVTKNDTFVCLGDVGKVKWIRKIKAGRKVLIKGNHDSGSKNYMRRIGYIEKGVDGLNHWIENDNGLFDEIYDGPLMIADKIMLSHEPIESNCWFNIHGHDHNGHFVIEDNQLNVTANVCDYTPISLKDIIKTGVLKQINSIHRIIIDNAIARKEQKENE